MEKKEIHPENTEVEPKEELKKIGERLRKIRKEKGYSSPDKFAYEHGINRSQYGKYEAGSEDLRISSLIKVLNKLGVTLSEFFSDKY
ncbi:helix-turn-helix domain-containing protein [Paradesertivirga mongoliensis]|uniref:Helix-turn-helix domain-containing protein n=1 Tax=Paradesertivirga mongoliensis TaxID=2100740 RepID=A0ABW4ZRF8_9SPHI|nr:helix-turn-helix domain-containing protein [Pedobacter mongoliensis]